MAYKEALKEKKAKPRRYSLNLKDITRLLSSAQDKRDQTIISLMAFNGLRLEEVGHIRRDWINFEQRTITIPTQAPEPYVPRRWYIEDGVKKPKDITDLNTWRPKTTGSAATIPILNWLDDWYIKLLFAYFSQKDWIGICGKSCYNHLKKTYKASGIKKPVYPHLLRHTHARLLRDRGFPPEDVMFLMRHQSLNTTWQYGKIEDKEKCTLLLKKESFQSL